MPSNKEFSRRIDIIDECLRNKYRKWTLDDLIKTVNEKLIEQTGKPVAKRTIQGDLHFMKVDKGAPIENIRDGQKTYIIYGDKDYSIKNLPINKEEVNYLKEAIAMLRQVNEFQILTEVDEIITKLENTIKVGAENSPAIIQFEKNTRVVGTQYIDSVFAAIKGKTPLRVTYQSFKAEVAEKCIFHPYLLKEYRNRWFLIGRKENNDFITTFALDRIKEIKNSNAVYIENDLFDAETYFNNLIGVTIPEGELVQPVEIKVISRQAPYIRTKPIHNTQEIIREYKNGDIIIRLWVIKNYELRSLLLSYGCDIEVLKPLSLRDEMKEIFENAFRCYQ